MWLRIFLPLFMVLGGVVRASAQEPAGGRASIHITAEHLLGAGGPSLRLGRAPLPSSFRLPQLSWASVSDVTAWTLPGGRVRPSLAGIPMTPLPPAGPVVAADADAADVGLDTAEAVGLFRELELPEVVQEVADLRLRVEGRGELGGAWRQFRPCEPGVDLNCNPDILPRLEPDIEFGIQVGGTITDRIHVDVDYDQRREFDAANNISVHYEGQPGEVLQRLEMGDVSIDLPASRYLTQGIPSGNFGFKTSARFGAVDVAAVWAQQKGDIATREFRLGGAGQSGLVQDQELVLDDTDYATGQFFFLVDPAELVGWPHVDIMTLDRTDAPAELRPLPERLALYRDEGVTLQRYADQAREGTFLADAVAAEGTLRHSGLFNLLEPGQDYYIHPSGLWVALRAPLRDDEALAVAYVSETGAEVGNPAAEVTPRGVTPELRLVRGPVTIHQPGQPTWPWEMHQVYRLDSSAQVETSTLDLVISLGHEAGGVTFKEFQGRPVPLLRLFGLDDDAPVDQVDLAHLFRPGAELDAFGASGIRGTFLVFPTLEPFGDPPPVPSEGLSAAESETVLGADANPAIYDEVDPVVRQSSSRFRLNFRYRVRLEGLLSSFNLGAFGIRQGSERISVDDRLLVRGVDYVVDYDLGLVTLLDPTATLGGNPDAEIRASWEQSSLFDIAPTTVFGVNAATPLGPYGDLNLMGMYQSEQVVVRRPQFGSAPGAVLLGGASGRLAFQADWLHRLMDAVPGLTVDPVARLDLEGELAVSSAEPNRDGHTYLDDFEATDELALSLDAAQWQLGSVPGDATGFPLNAWPLSVENAADLVWQDRYRVGEREVGFLTPREIDEQIAFAGARLAEPVLYLTMGGNGAEAPQWRSLTTVLSTTGLDLSRSEYLEFYAAPMSGPTGELTLVVDVGTVSEDAFYFDDTGALTGTTHGLPWGQGVLDAEARLDIRQVWGPENDRRGLWGQECEAERLTAVPLGAPRANCTVLNGRPDSEDLNGNGVLDGTDGPSFRFVIPLTSNSPYLVRGQQATGTPFRLFRVPLRGMAAQPLSGATDATWRFVKQMRMTVVKPASGQGTLALARVRIAGSRWTKRDLDGVLSGLTGSTPGTGAVSTTLRVGTASRLTDGAAYESPPGIEDEIQDPKSAIGPTGVEFNEKSLRISWDGLPSDERAEVYFRYPQQPRNFLEYRQIRFWAAPRAGAWGPSGDHELLFKLGTDPSNYYIFRSSLHPVTTPAGVSAGDWLPERVVAVDEWLALKAEAERRMAEDRDGGPLVLWSDDGRYGIVVEDRARAPNLAAVRELSLAVYNRGGGDTQGEVWINDLRLGDGSTGPGLAGRMNMDLNAGGVFAASVAFGGRGGRFRQMEGSPTWETVNDLSINTTTQLGRLAPESWGIAMPLTVSYLRTDLDPIFLPGTDVRAQQLPGLREAGTSRRRVGVSLRKTTPTGNPVLSALIDGTVLRAGHIRSSDATVTTASRLDGFDGGIELDRRVADVGIGIVPGFVETLLRWIAPARVERSAFFDRVTDARLRLTPERIGLSTGYVHQDASVWRYGGVLESPADLDARSTESPRRSLESGANVTLRPLESLTARIGLVSDRDVLDPDRATPLTDERQALQRARGEVAGLPIGWERGRVLTTDAAFRPAVADWLRPSVSWTSRFGQRRDPSNIALITDGDTTVASLQRTFHGDRRYTRAVVFDPGGALRAALLPTGAAGPGQGAESAVTEGAEGVGGAGAADGAADGAAPGVIWSFLLTAVRPVKRVELTWTDEVGSRFDRKLAEPGYGYQLGWGTLDRFRAIDGDTAAMALVREAFRARSGVRLGSSASLDVGYTDSDARVVDIAAGLRTQDERSWPDVRFSWPDAPVPGWASGVLDRWSFSTGFIRTARVTHLGGTTMRVRSQLERTVPVEFRLGLSAGLAFSYIGSITTGDGQDPTGYTEQSAMTHAVGLSGRFPAPAPLRRAIPQPVRLSFSWDYQEQEQNRIGAALVGVADPTPFIDHINRRVSLTVSSLIQQMDVGLQGSYIDRRSFIGTQAGSSQFQLSLFGQFNVQAGEF